ncbi:MAG: T9SS type A sorting domain-containing protein [Bacteroidota bacterium]|nr:T9SS type A sorting domain-containing protein [Candidatus Kapabacteria bacterium]MDW8271984.1 T9SS type A sorting domain-containing protein [Bacteroidota bacterium]
MKTHVQHILRLAVTLLIVSPAVVWSQALTWRGTISDSGNVQGISLGPNSTVAGVNIHGALLINTVDSRGKPTAYVWKPDVVWQVDTAAYPVTAHDLSDEDPPRVVGSFEMRQPTGETESRAFRWAQQMGMQDLGTLGRYRMTSANRMTSNGQTCLFTTADERVARGNPDVPTSVQELAAFQFSSGRGIADNPLTVGIFVDSLLGVGSFVWPSTGQIVVFPEPVPGSPLRVAGISPNGRWAAGDYMDTTGRLHGVRVDGERLRYQPLALPGNVVSVEIAAVANNGYVVGTGYDQQGNPRVILWTAPDRPIDVTNLVQTRLGAHCMLERGLSISSDGYIIAGEMWNTETAREEVFAVEINFEPEVPTIEEPADNATGSGTPTFRFRSSDPEGDSLLYFLEIWKQGDGRVFEVGWLGSNVVATFSIPADQALSPGQWRWQVHAMDKRGAVSPRTEPRTYTVRDDSNQPPETPTLTSPIDNATTSPTPTLVATSTDPNQHDIRYHFELTNGMETRTYQTGYMPSGTASNFTIPSNDPLPQGGWRWRARAEDILGALSAWSQYASFTVQVSSVEEPFRGIVQISPNPATDGLTITWTAERARNLVLEMRDMLGRTVVRQDFGAVNYGTTTVETSAFPPGVYMLIMRDGNSTYRDVVVIIR